MAKYRCAVCGYVFEETEDKKFSDLTKCPVCGQPVSQFEPVEEPAEEEKGPAAEENPLAYPKEYFLSLIHILLSGDYVPESVCRELKTVWETEVFHHWGMTETGYGGAVECGAHAGGHLRHGDLYLEIVDPKTGKPVPAGSYGELVLTTFARRGMPLIRYRTGDIGRLLTDVYKRQLPA